MGAQDNDTDNETDPVPDRRIVVGESLALLVMVAIPVPLPLAAGANVTLMVVGVPGGTFWPEDNPLRLNPEPEILTSDTVMSNLLELVSVTESTLLLPTATLPNFKLDCVALNGPALFARVPLQELEIAIMSSNAHTNTLYKILPVALLVSCVPGGRAMASSANDLPMAP